MKTRNVFAALFVVTLLEAPAFADSLFLIIDENGNSSGSAELSLTSSNDGPNNGPLIYSLVDTSYSFSQGYLGITDGPGGPIEDVLFFDGFTITFWSGDLLGSLADVGPAGLSDLLLNVTPDETVPEGSAGEAIYTPALGPGRLVHSTGEIAFPVPITYTIQSDEPAAIPEPSTVVSLAFMGLAWSVYAWRRRKR